MSVEPQQTALLRYLHGLNPLYYGKILELRDAVKGWLNYIPQSFPHYTRHTVEHSDEIILQVSKMLFLDDGTPKEIHLSAVEAYIIAAAAYLHDSGMVVPDAEKAKILASDSWRKWITDGAGAKRWREIALLRDNITPSDPALRYFLADIQVRFLIAEFVRGSHHLRAADVIANHQPTLGRFAFDDPVLQQTISDVCVAHGLRTHELEDRTRFPDRRDIRGESVNVRLMAILLRLGDLLDMDNDRACPLLLNAACPIPADSLAHWTQYSRIRHRLTAPDVIEIEAECLTDDEHRILQDWCQWIVDEVHSAASLVARCQRHQNWHVPIVQMEGDRATIAIRPAPGAIYVPSKWQFHLDNEAIFQRLIYDVYDSPNVFIRELIQNALDASRCQMYADMERGKLDTPEYPTEAPESWRKKYPVSISLREIDVFNNLSGETEKRQVLAIEDYGIGMDKDVIERYFLQVGRSYYITDEFRQTYRFNPTSRFGVGFLSVFAVSDHVIVETFRPSSPRQDGPLRLTLKGPRNYLLTERGQRQSSGTRIEVMLNDALKPGELAKLVSGWCRRVEFPVIVDDLGNYATIEAERPQDFSYDIPDVTEQGAKFLTRFFPVSVPGVEGEIYIFAHLTSAGESWADWNLVNYNYVERHPGALKPTMPDSLGCINGISLEYPERPARFRYFGHTSGMSARIDFRYSVSSLTMSRTRNLEHHVHLWLSSTAAQAVLAEIVEAHLKTTFLATGDDGWEYKQKLMEAMPFIDYSFWSLVPASVRVIHQEEVTLVSLQELTHNSEVVTLHGPWLHPQHALDRSAHSGSTVTENAYYIIEGDLRRMSNHVLSEVFDRLQPNSTTRLGTDSLRVTWRPNDNESKIAPYSSAGNVHIITFSNDNDPAYVIRHHGYHIPQLFLNKNHILGRWFSAILTSYHQGQYGLEERHLQGIRAAISGNFERVPRRGSEFERYISEWNALASIPDELKLSVDELWPISK